MQRRIALLCLLFVLLMSASAFAVEFKTKPKLAFYPLVAKSVEAISFTEAISTQLFNNIERTDFFEILERKKVESALFQDAATLAAMSQDGLYGVASRAGFDIFVVGSVSRVENASLIDLKVVSAGSRNSYFGETFRVAEYETPKRLQEITEKIVAQVKAFNIGAPAETKIGCPANLNISGTPKSIRLKWSPATSPQVIGYAVMRAASANGTYVQVATTTQPSYTDDNLKLNETFYYKVKAISKSGIECELSAPIIGKTSLAPHPPILIDIKSELGGARLNWYSRPYSGNDRNQVTNGYQIYRKAPDEPEYRGIARVAADATSFLDNEMKNGVTYSYAVASVNPEGVESELSSTLEAKTAQAATNIKATGGKRKVQLTWLPNDSRSIEGYAIYRSAAAAGTFQRVAQVKGRGTDSYLDSGLEDSVTYWYCIAAMLERDETPKSDPVSATTTPRPAPPTGLSASDNEPRRVPLSWQNAAKPEDEIKAYYLYRATEKEGEFSKIAELPATKNGYLDEREKGTEKGLSRLSTLVSDGTRPLADGGTYYYRITCVNEAGSESLPSQTISATTRPLLSAPKQLKASSGLPGKVNLSWDPSPEFKEYEVYRGTVGQVEVTRIKTVKEPFYVDSSVDDGASYIYAVKGIDAFQIPSMITTSVTGTTKPRPATPKGVSVVEKEGRQVLQWEPNPEKDIAKYVVYRKNFVGIFQKQESVNGTYYVIEGGKGKVELKVSAEDADGLESERSEVQAVELK